MRRAARVDANQSSLVELLRTLGCLVQDLSAVGQGVPDLLVYHPRCGLVLVEIKDGALPPSRQALTPVEAAWHRRWSSAPLYIISSHQAVLDMLVARSNDRRCHDGS